MESTLAAPDFNSIISNLRDDANAATWNLGYMKAVLDNPLVPDKLGQSFSGYAMEVATAAVKRSLALYCARAWDEDADAISLPNATKWLPDPTDDKTKARRERYLENFAKAAKDESRPSIRVFRTEWLAHRVTNSKDRKKLEKLNPVVDITLNDLVRCAEQTIVLAGEIGFLGDGLANPFPERIERVERYCREFWRVLPVLGDIENFEIG